MVECIDNQTECSLSPGEKEITEEKMYTKVNNNEKKKMEDEAEKVKINQKFLRLFYFTK